MNKQEVESAFQELTSLRRKVADLDAVESLLGWDQQVKMPPKGAEQRTRQLAILAEIMHREDTNPRVGELLGQLQQAEQSLNGAISDDQKVLLREWAREWKLATALPEAFASESAATASDAYACWIEARGKNDFSHFLPSMKKIIDLKFRQCEYFGMQDRPYDSLLDLFDPGLTVEKVESLFKPLHVDLVAILKKITEKNVSVRTDLLQREWPEENQRALATELVTRFGFDFEAGRVDTSPHPFCSGSMNDIRLTTRYNESDPRMALFGLCHEAGHGMYEQGFNHETWGTPLSGSMGMAIHESQSLFWEDYISRSPAFWDFAWPLAKQHFPEQLHDVSQEEWILFCNEVKPSLIRVEADEVTYPLHIIVRFEIERDIFNGSLKPDDVRQRWNELYVEYLGIDPPDDNHGVLQDVHWSFAFGYFPSYALGKLIAAMWWNKLRGEMDLDGLAAKGEFSPILGWMRENIHRQGKRYWAPELVKRAAGKELSSEDYLGYLKHKFYPLYGVEG